MKNHTKIYLQHFGMVGYDEPSFIPCEFCNSPSVDIHHLKPRGMGGSKTKDYIENLMATCRECHNECESNSISKEDQIQTHLDYLKLHS